MHSNSKQAVIAALKEGQFVIVHDPQREEEGDFFLLARHATPERMNYLLQHARGMINVALSGDICDALGLDLLVPKSDNTSEFGTNFSMFVDAAVGISTGVSAPDRACTVRMLGSSTATPADFIMPGHTGTLRAMAPHLRFGHTEAAIELAKMAQEHPAVVICEILNAEGLRATEAQQRALATDLNCPVVLLEDVKAWVDMASEQE